MSVVGHKQSRTELSPSCTCTVCWEVLYDPVTLPCGHSLDQRCLQKVLATEQRGCPTCRAPLPAEVPAVNVQLREVVEERYPQQVRAPAPSRAKHPIQTPQWGLLGGRWCVGAGW